MRVFPAPVILLILLHSVTTSAATPATGAPHAIAIAHTQPVATIEALKPLPDSTAHDTLIYVPADQFVHAGVPRATLYGDLPLARTHIDPLRAAIVGGIYGGVIVGLHMNMSGAWWEDRGEFKLKNDWDDVLQIDKAGHAFSGYAMAYGFGEGLMAAGIAWEPATIAGGTLGLLYQSYVEMEDGFSEGWGFSLTDMAANAFGSGLYVAQFYSPFLQNFTPKYQYVPPSWIGVPRSSTTWIDDYNSSTMWLSVNLHNLLPERTAAVVPPWLELAFGYGIRADGEKLTRRFIIAIDYDLRQVLPEGGHVWNWFRQTLNFVKLPAPAIEFSSGAKFHLLFPFEFRMGDVRF